MTNRFHTITLLTDLGLADESVGILHSVIRDLAPQVSVTDLGHDVTPGDVRVASVMLAKAAGYLPAGVVAVCVGAGITADRRCVAVSVAGGEGVLVGPDSGVLAPAVAMIGGAEQAVVLDDPAVHLPSPGAVWPARDVIVPVACALAGGASLADVGSPIDPDLLLPGVVPLTRRDGDALVADVLAIDRSGACQLNVDPAELAPWGDLVTVRIGEVVRTARLVRAGAAPLAAGAVGFVVDAFGMISLIAGERRAADELGAGPLSQVVISALDPDDQPSVPRPSSPAAVPPVPVVLGRPPTASRPGGPPLG